MGKEILPGSGIVTGYKGQRYEVRALRPKGDAIDGAATEPFVVGWTEQEDGGGLVKMVRRHPTWRSAVVVDLGAEFWDRSPGNLDWDGSKPPPRRS